MTTECESKAEFVESVLERLSGGVIAGWDDLAGLGECLILLDELESAAQVPSEQWLEDLRNLRELFNGLILEESCDPEEDRRRIPEMVSALCEGMHFSSGEGQRKSEDEEDTEPFGPWTGKDLEEASLHSEVGETRDPELVNDFIDEAREHLASIELNLLSLEANPEDSEAIDAVFRPFHSIKGVSGFLNFKDIHRLSHGVENLLDAVRRGERALTEGVVDVVLQAVDLLKKLLETVSTPQGEGKAYGPGSRDAEAVDVFLKHLRELHEEEEGSEPAPDVPAVGSFQGSRVGSILVERGVLDVRHVEEAVRQSQSRGARLGEELVRDGLASPREVGGALREQRRRRRVGYGVRVDMRKLDHLADTIGELVIAQSMVLQNQHVARIKDQKLQKDTVQLRRVTAELQRITMSMRMVPVKGAFQPMIRLVRDLARKSGKEIALEMEGEDTEIDRSMVEQIHDPLVHLVRNAVDHGIETPEERQGAGKPRRGTIRLSASQGGGSIVLDIRDDGRGLDAENIRAKAIKTGLLPPEETAREDETYELIFHAGFSTREKVTEVSGRGVGMDVVKTAVEKLRGKLAVFNTPGRGAHFQIRLPLTTAIIDGMTVRVGDQRYVVPTLSVREFLQPQESACRWIQRKLEMVHIREALLPLVRLHRLLEVPPERTDPWEAILLVVHEGDRRYCLMADEIIGRQEVVIKSLGGAMRHLRGVSGGAILGDGRVALILDIRGIVSLFQESRG